MTKTKLPTIEKLRAMKPKTRAKFFRSIEDQPEAMEVFTVPCNGEAHGNAYIDGCMICLNVTWGRMLRPSED